MREVVEFEYCLSAMLDRLHRSICLGDQALDLIALHVGLCCLDYSYKTAWICVIQSYWHANLEFKHRHS